MDNLTNFLSGKKIVKKQRSKINGTLTVTTDFFWGTHIMAGGLTQSGGVAKNIWKDTLSRFKKKDIKSCLILGLGGGSIAGIVSNFWPQAKITGVDIDPQIIALGKKYLKLNAKNVKIHIQDAAKFVKEKGKYDLICLDTYIGDSFPPHLEEKSFLSDLSSSLSSDGLLIVNRLYSSEKRKDALKLEKKLLEVFPKVDRFFPEANIMFLCYPR
jgi:spermidine synthase